jgi:hypothetical protein
MTATRRIGDSQMTQDRPLFTRWIALALIGAGILATMLLVARPAQAAAPSNDNFANAATFGTVPGQAIGRNNDATRQTGEPDNGYATVWWKWTATQSGRFHLDTCDTVPSFSSVIGVYTGSSVSQLTQRANSKVLGEDCPDYSGVKTYFDAVAGTTYYISVGGWYSSSQSLNIRLSLRRTPLNDNFAAATPFGKRQGTVTGTNVEATRETGEPDNGNRTVWWKWTAPRSDRYFLDTCKTVPSFASVIGVYVGSNVAQLLQKANSRVSGSDCPDYSGVKTYFDAVAGTTYYISVGGWYTSSQSSAIRLTMISKACIDALKAAGQANGGVKRAQHQLDVARQRYLNAVGPAAKANALRILNIMKGRFKDAVQTRNRAQQQANLRCAS